MEDSPDPITPEEKISWGIGFLARALHSDTESDCGDGTGYESATTAVITD